jgi:uncharacterized protein YbaP (TraB family)
MRSLVRQTLVVAGVLAALAVPAVAEPALFAARDDDTTVYLFGTIHLTACEAEGATEAAPPPRKQMAAPARCPDWMSGTVRSAFAAADELWIETVDVTDEAVLLPLIQQMGYLPDGMRLTDLIPEAELRTVLGMAGPSMEAMLPQFDTMQPWLVSMMLGVASMTGDAAEPEEGVDLALVRLAGEMGIPVLGLETGEFQVRLLASDPLEVQVADLRSTAILLNHDIDIAALSQWMLGKLWELWLAGDLDSIAAMVIGTDVEFFEQYEDELTAFLDVGKAEIEAIDREVAALYVGIADPEERAIAAYERLIGERNRNWIKQIVTMLDRPGTFFVAVGAAHLAGDDAVQALLQQRGVAVTRVQ